MKEIEIMRQIQDYLEYNGCLVIRLNNAPIPLPDGKGYRRALKRGLPDLMAFIPRKKGLPISIMIEVKSEKGKLSSDQERFLADADLIGIKCYIARSLEFIQNELRPYFNTNT